MILITIERHLYVVINPLYPLAPNNAMKINLHFIYIILLLAGLMTVGCLSARGPLAATPSAPLRERLPAVEIAADPGPLATSDGILPDDPLRLLRNELPEKLAHVVEMSLHKKLEARYQSGDQFANDLRLAMADFCDSAPAIAPTAFTNKVSAPLEKLATSQNAEVLKPIAVPGNAQGEAEIFATTVNQSISQPPAQSATTYDATEVLDPRDDLFRTTQVMRPGNDAKSCAQPDTDPKL